MSLPRNRHPADVAPNPKGLTMTRSLILALALAATPFAAMALPAVGDMVGTKPEDATIALKAAGCTDPIFDVEDGQIEAKCTDDATGKVVEVYIDPKTGAVTNVKVDG